ncbi:DsbA family oxidoreductase [Paenibacillus tarimensis]
MKIEIWSDFICPFCYIGKRRFEAALEQFEGKESVEIIYKSFELDPQSKRDLDHDIHDMIAMKYSISRERAIAMHEGVTEQAQAVGLTYRFDTAIPTNTFDAHRLMHYADQHGKMREMTERLLKAYFTESKHIGDHETLAGLAAEVGLDKNGASNMLAGNDCSEEVRADEQEAGKLGIRGVPHFVINRKYAITGAQPSEVFLQALQRAWAEEQPLMANDDDAGQSAADGSCGDGICVPKK